MDVTRRNFIQRAAVAGAAGIALNAATDEAEAASRNPRRKKRTVYFNDARHYYLFVFEPPMTLEDAWRPIDECAGTTVDTFVYGVARNDGLFYPSKVGLRWGEDQQPFTFAAYYRMWQNMQSLIDRGLDPLTVLIDRAHDKGMEFFASLRMASIPGTDPKHDVAKGGRGLAEPEMREHQYRVLEELATRYDSDGVELDFAASPGGQSPFFRPEDVEKNTPVLTELVRRISKTVRDRPGRPGAVGVRVYPTEEICLEQGIDIRTWIQEGLVDYILPMLYIDFTLDQEMPIEGLVELAHEHDTAIYGMLQPYTQDGATGAPQPIHLTPATTRAAAANYYAKGVDGVYSWFLDWPLGDAERRSLAEFGDPDLIKEGDKLYVKRRRGSEAVKMGYDADLPIEIPEANPAKRYVVPFTIADDVANAGNRIRQITLRLKIRNLVSADRLSIRLNGQSLENETCRRDLAPFGGPYSSLLLEFTLERIRPRQGKNTLEISLDKRPNLMEGGIGIENVEVLIEYGVFPSGLIS